MDRSIASPCISIHFIMPFNLELGVYIETGVRSNSSTAGLFAKTIAFSQLSNYLLIQPKHP